MENVTRLNGDRKVPGESSAIPRFPCFFLSAPFAHSIVRLDTDTIWGFLRETVPDSFTTLGHNPLKVATYVELRKKTRFQFPKSSNGAEITITLPGRFYDGRLVRIISYSSSIPADRE